MKDSVARLQDRGGQNQKWRLLRSGFRQKFVFIDYSSDRDFAVRIAVVDANYSAFAPHADALSQSDFRGECECKLNISPNRDVGVNVEANAPGAYIPRLRGSCFRFVLRITQRNR